MADSELEFFNSLPRTRSAASALLRDTAGRILLVKPTYRPGWGLPGGVIEMGESPREACLRECSEELGLTPQLSGLVCVDWLPAHANPDRRPATVFVFGGLLRPGQFEAVRLPPDELSAAHLVAPERISEYLPEPQARRVAACIAEADSGIRYLEYGHPVRWGVTR